MDKSLVQKLKWCRRELAALKIAHEQSLEGVSFFTATASELVTINLFTYVIVYINYDEVIVNEPFCQCYMNNPQLYDEIDLYFSSNQHRLYLIPFWLSDYSDTVNVKVVSSAEIKSIEIVIHDSFDFSNILLDGNNNE